MRRPLILPEGAVAPPHTLAVDAPVTGAVAVYSHWRDAGRTPPSLMADTSTEMLVRAAHDEERWLAPYAVVANTHLDADGLLALACAVRPDLARDHGRLLVDTACCGDFTAWTTEAAFRLMLVLHQVMRDEPHGPGRENAIAQRVCDDLPALLDRARTPDEERDAAVAQVVAAIDRLRRRDGVTITAHPGWWSIAWTRRLGHASDVFGLVHRPDDLPLWTLDAVVPDHVLQLTSEATPDGWRHVLEAPRHSWARTVVRPTVPWPDLAPLAARLAEGEPEAGWCARPGAAQAAFTGLLACTRSFLSPADLTPILAPHLP